MTKSEALAFYRTRRNLARALGIAEHTVNGWDRTGGVIPDAQQLKLEALTAGALRADDSAWAPVRPRYEKKRGPDGKRKQHESQEVDTP